MNYFKKMIGIRRMNDDGWAANYGVARKAGYQNSERHKQLINRDRRAKKKWVKNHEAKLHKREEEAYAVDSSSDMSEHHTPEKMGFVYRHFLPDEA